MCLLLTLGLLASAQAQTFPSRPLRIILGFTPGTGADITARAVGQKLSERFGQPVIVENRVGASATLATERVATAQPDGHTLLVLTSAEPPQAALGRKLNYDLRRDLQPISMMANGPLLVAVSAPLPASNVHELVALVLARGGKLTCGSGGVGTATHLAQVLFNLKTKTSTTHVPFKGAPESVVAVAGGEIDMSFPGIPATLPHIESGKVRALAVTSARRASLLPNVPTLDESGVGGYELVSWYGIAAPAGVAGSIIDKLNGAVAQAINAPEMKASLIKQGFEPFTNTPGEFRAMLEREIAQGAALVKAAGITWKN
jgi:tripartite-type tricarboxylate transporter receptor subunit TctC